MAKAARYKGRMHSFIHRYGVGLVFLAMLLYNAIVTPNFVSVGLLSNLIVQSCPIIICGMGMTMAISSSGIDISVGSVMAFSGMVLVKLMTAGYPLALCIAIAIFLSLLFGFCAGFMIGYFKIQAMITTLTMQMVARGVAQLINNGNVQIYNNPKLMSLGTAKFFDIFPIQIVYIIVIVGFVCFIMNRSILGRHIQAVGDNERAARMVGINTEMVIIIVYLLCALFAGIAGVIETARLSAADGAKLGKSIHLDAIAATTVGGTPMGGGRARVLWTLVGAIMMQLITIMVNMNNIAFEYSYVIKAIVIVVSIYLQREKQV